MIGNSMKVGDKIMFNGMICTIKEIQENRIIGGKTMTGRQITGMKVPDILTLEIDLPFECEKPFNGVIVQVPAELEKQKVQ